MPKNTILKCEWDNEITLKQKAKSQYFIVIEKIFSYRQVFFAATGMNGLITHRACAECTIPVMGIFYYT